MAEAAPLTTTVPPVKGKPGRKPLNASPKEEPVTAKSVSVAAAATTTTTTFTSKALQTAKEEDAKKVAELEAQLGKLQKQINAEKNKFNAQKKKLEKVQSELEKSADAIQIVQIDLSCQKADNNNLIAENIALK